MPNHHDSPACLAWLPGFFLRKLTIMPALHAFRRRRREPPQSYNPPPFQFPNWPYHPKPIPFLMCLHVRPPPSLLFFWMECCITWIITRPEYIYIHTVHLMVMPQVDEYIFYVGEIKIFSGGGYTQYVTRPSFDHILFWLLKKKRHLHFVEDEWSVLRRSFTLKTLLPFFLIMK